jgi:hypothetical protein
MNNEIQSAVSLAVSNVADVPADVKNLVSAELVTAAKAEIGAIRKVRGDTTRAIFKAYRDARSLPAFLTCRNIAEELLIVEYNKETGKGTDGIKTITEYKRNVPEYRSFATRMDEMLKTFRACGPDAVPDMRAARAEFLMMQGNRLSQAAEPVPAGYLDPLSDRYESAKLGAELFLADFRATEDGIKTVAAWKKADAGVTKTQEAADKVAGRVAADKAAKGSNGQGDILDPNPIPGALSENISLLAKKIRLAYTGGVPLKLLMQTVDSFRQQVQDIEKDYTKNRGPATPAARAREVASTLPDVPRTGGDALERDLQIPA